jgi:hypothetical protein
MLGFSERIGNSIAQQQVLRPWNGPHPQRKSAYFIEADNLQFEFTEYLSTAIEGAMTTRFETPSLEPTSNCNDWVCPVSLSRVPTL